MLQQYLPLAVLKRRYITYILRPTYVATVLTACGIETGNPRAVEKIID